jgi:hypothetical protein
MTTDNPGFASGSSTELDEKLGYALGQLEQARPFAKGRHRSAFLDLAGRLLVEPGGLERLYELATRFDEAGVFVGTDWAEPSRLLPAMVRNTLDGGDRQTVVLDCLSQLRMLAVATERYRHPSVSAEQARHFLTQVLALNMGRVTGSTDEATRARLGAPLAGGIDAMLRFLLSRIGYEDILGSLVEEIWRLLAQRPIQVSQIRAMVTEMSLALAGGVRDLGDARLGADRLISALFGPTHGSQDDPGVAAYTDRLEAMDGPALHQEAYGFARAMHDTGLVSDYHASFLRWLLSSGNDHLLSDALGLSSTGLDTLRSYSQLVQQLIEESIFPETAQAVYGLSCLLERGILYNDPIAPALWRQLGLKLSEVSATTLAYAFGSAVPARTRLLAGVISLLGQPLGIGQGNNPTCQSARAISMWSYNDPDYLLHLIAQVARYNNILMHFEGQPLESAALPHGSVSAVPLDTDPVSLLLVPHLDRIYHAMGRLCATRADDPHRWINPEFHGWWVGREFMIALDVASGKLHDYEAYLRQFYASYHPFFNGNQPLIHPQPAGIAVTDSHARFVGWHAITILRVALDQQDVMRVYFFNPNNDSGQDWGNGVVVSTQGHGERYGEASLPFPELASRLYIFHDDPVGDTDHVDLPEDELASVRDMALQSWASDRIQQDLTVAAEPPAPA